MEGPESQDNQDHRESKAREDHQETPELRDHLDPRVPLVKRAAQGSQESEALPDPAAELATKVRASTYSPIWMLHSQNDKMQAF